MNLHAFIDLLYSASPFIYDLQLNFFNGNHFQKLKKKLNKIPTENILEIGCGTAPILKVFRPKSYVGIDIDEKFIKLAQKIYKNTNYSFSVGDARNIDAKTNFDMILFSHTTHHLSDNDIKKVIDRIKKISFSYLVIYDGKPISVFAPLLLRLDYNAAKFRRAEEFIPLFEKDFKIEHIETFRSNRPFYEYPLLILSKKKIRTK